jgi:hypothetical protein
MRSRTHYFRHAYHPTRGDNMFLFFLWLDSPIQALAASMKLSISLQLLDLGQSVGLLGRVISSLQGLYLYTNTEKCTHKH